MSTTLRIQSTTNYKQFKRNSLQRTFTDRKVDKIRASMSQSGFWPSSPVSVFKSEDGKLTINTGHHRVAAAESLGLPVLYVIEHEYSAKELALEGNFITNWAVKDQATCFAKDGNKHFEELLEAAKLGMPINLAASMLHGESAGSGNAKERIADGTFKVKTRDQFNKWRALRDEFIGRSPAICHRAFVACYSKCLFTPEFDNDIFTKRLRRNPMMLDKTSNDDQMMRLIEEIYNFGTPNKIPLAFIVTRNSKDRKATFGKVGA